MELISLNRLPPPSVVFTTAFSEYAVKSYELEAIDYLMKTITYERFSQALAKYSKIQLPEPEIISCFFKVNGKLIKLGYNDAIVAQFVKRLHHYRNEAWKLYYI
ncbi:DNA-binding LytR/AlgR family response regulator [Pedobacter sp. UYP30]|uniref:LytR/AlgR family response regulator transcription factor n=1 Tax=Pedobacter sp. UYP30 TaxID=1756400 RepID=UPI003395BDA1